MEELMEVVAEEVEELIADELEDARWTLEPAKGEPHIVEEDILILVEELKEAGEVGRGRGEEEEVLSWKVEGEEAG
jgi:hypothetical protein